jgi:hypothetical protein
MGISLRYRGCASSRTRFPSSTGRSCTGRFSTSSKKATGRIHRYGQADDVWVYNLVAQNTREGSVLQKVLSKLDVMREQMGSDRVYDVIDEWLEDVPLVRLIESAIDNDDESAGARETDAALTTASHERAARLMALQKKTSLASRVDLRSARALRDASDERRLQPLFIQRFFERAWTACGMLANPPFNVGDWGGEFLIRDDKRWGYGVPLAGNTNFPWVKHFLYHLVPGGIAGSVLANGATSLHQSGEWQSGEQRGL